MDSDVSPKRDQSRNDYGLIALIALIAAFLVLLFGPSEITTRLLIVLVLGITCFVFELLSRRVQKHLGTDSS